MTGNDGAPKGVGEVARQRGIGQCQIGEIGQQAASARQVATTAAVVHPVISNRRIQDCSRGSLDRHSAASRKSTPGRIRLKTRAGDGQNPRVERQTASF